MPSFAKGTRKLEGYITRDMTKMTSLAREDEQEGWWQVREARRGDYYAVNVCGSMSRCCARDDHVAADWLASIPGVNKSWMPRSRFATSPANLSGAAVTPPTQPTRSIRARPRVCYASPGTPGGPGSPRIVRDPLGEGRRQFRPGSS
jgi:hypothetical protein